MKVASHIHRTKVYGTILVFQGAFFVPALLMSTPLPEDITIRSVRKLRDTDVSGECLEKPPILQNHFGSGSVRVSHDCIYKASIDLQVLIMFVNN